MQREIDVRDPDDLRVALAEASRDASEFDQWRPATHDDTGPSV